jgi:acyl-coenzyme A thioesterase PaaI-like protein
MPFDPFAFIKGIEKNSPRFARMATMCALSLISPFNRHLKARLMEWNDEKAVIQLRRIRRVRNHVGSIHAGALFTLGETCAGLVIIRNFPFKKFRPLMSDVKVTYSKQARGDVTGEAIIPAADIERMHETIRQGEVPSLEVTTNIFNDQREMIAVVTTTWQVKSWQLVKVK